VGRITQALKRLDLPDHEMKPIRTTQWKILRIKPYGPPGIEVLTDIRIYFIHDITLPTFNHINHNNLTAPFVYEYVRASLICDVCLGSGITDWISKAAARSTKLTMFHLTEAMKYIRNKRGPVKKMVDIHGDTIYTSTPKVRRGEELCIKCGGCGISFSEIMKSIEEITFDEC